MKNTLPIDKIIQGDTLQVLKTFPDDCIDCIITSPPYWGLRDYGEQTNTVWDGDPDCEHEFEIIETKRPNASGGKTEYAKQKLAIKGTENYSEFVDYNNRVTKSHFCSKCGAWYGQLGLEPTLDLYLEHMLQITSELKRVLKPTGVMFWNMGDNYSNQNTLLKEYSIEDNWLRLLGWIYTDGTVLRNGSRICIYQSKERGIKEIESLLNILGLRYTIHGPHKRNFMFYILAEDSRKINEKLCLNGKKILPEWLYFCSRRQIIVFLEAIISGDGSRRKYDTAIYGTRERLEPLEELLESKDISCKLYQNKRGDWLLQVHQELWNPKYIKEKSLCFQNYRLILRMIDEQGWILRNVIIWHKPNHMPSSVKDRFTNSYEPVFMLTKSKRYWFDLDAVRVPHKTEAQDDYYISIGKSWHNHLDDRAKGAGQKDVRTNHPLGKNPGDLWTIPTQPFPEAHFATFPERLVEPMIKAGCPEWICKKCGKHRERITKTKYETDGRKNKPVSDGGKTELRQNEFGTFHYGKVLNKISQTIGWTDCGCKVEGNKWKPGIVLDPFAGSGTTLYTARKLNRHYIGIELNPEYIKMAKKRLSKFGKRLEEFIEE